ncbi:MAG TPA: hypothetical protein VEF37_02340 [Thermodesulfovibrionales bacterium]|nr:hypothetical protein [Thermodesulfovibrionales bacterium]
MAEEKRTTSASEEQIAYAKVLNVLMFVGLAIMVVTFIIYMSGILSSFIPPQEIPKYWGMKSSNFIHTLNAPTGWGWTAMIDKGDYLNFIGIALLAGLTMVCYLVILPILMRKKDIPYVVIAIAEVAVLALAASGILKSGGH